MVEQVINSYKDYLTNKYKATAYRVGVDGGFSCPNKSDGRTSSGCTYCDTWGSRSALLGEEDQSIGMQVERSLKVLKKRYGATVFLLFFQAYSNTYSDVKTLKSRWDEGLSLGPFKELIVSTRPDCLDEDKVDLLASYIKDDFDVWVELGLQSSHQQTLDRIGRGHSVDDFCKSYKMLKKKGIKVAVHLIFGLPGENHEMMMSSVDFVSSLKPDGVKFHNLHIPSGSPMFQEYKRGELSFPSSKRHLVTLADAIERTPMETIILRISTDTPTLRHNLPGSFMNKTALMESLILLLKQRGTKQGDKFC